MTNPNFFIGAPIQFKKGVKIYPPFVKDIINNPRFGVYEKLLTYAQEDIEDELVESGKKIDSFPTPLEFLMINCQHSKEYRQLCQEAFEFFLKEKVTFLLNEKIIVVGDIQAILPSIKSLDDLVLIKEEEFFAFQNLIRESVGGKPVDAPNPNMHPRLKAMKAKARLRDRVKAKQAAKNGVNLTATLASICCMGIGITPLNVGEMSYVAVQTITQVYQNKEKYQLDIDSLLAGADSKKVKPKYWIRNLEE